jgi:hypothetical protein
MAKKKQILFLPPGQPGSPESGDSPRSSSRNIKEVDIFHDLDMIAKLARRRAHGKDGGGNAVGA